MKWLYLAAACLLLQACGGSDAPEGPPAAPASCSLPAQRESLRDFMDQDYYWHSQARVPDDQAGTPEAYFRSLLYKPLDRYSFAEPTAAFDQLYVEGRRIGYGFTMVWGDATRTSLRVRNVEPLSPAARAGLARGDTILEIDGFSPAQIAAGGLPTVNTPGVMRRFVVRQVSGAERVVTAQSEDFPLSPLAGTTTLDVVRDGAPVKVGYLAYHQFTGYSWQRLREAFAKLREEGAGELILDLRYNGGGSVLVARDLASLIAGPRGGWEMFAHLRFNEKRPGNGIQLRFNPAATADGTPHPGFDRVIVIASGATASASELLVNGLRPVMDVVLVGDTTYGKPYGFTPRRQCGVTYNAVQFEAFNALGVAGYTAGFAPDCPARDDLDAALGDPAERSVGAALDYIATGSCGQAPRSSQMPGTRVPPEVFGETLPKRMYVQE
jgi:carboxyl-terminal processing protease